MPARTPRPAATHASRLARQAWLTLHTDSQRSIDCADRALALALERGDAAAEAGARLARGFHLLYFAPATQALPALEKAEACARRIGDRAGEILAATGRARAMWRAGLIAEAHALVQPLRDEGLAVLKNEQRGVLLNTIAGCWSALGRPDQAFAYMFQALRDSGPARGRGFDIVLYCNLAHELLQIGDHAEALAHVDIGLERCAGAANPRLHAVLLINRVISLTELRRPADALADIERLAGMPADSRGRGVLAAHYETLAIAALRAARHAQGAELVAQALARGPAALPEEQVELAIARALLDQAEGRGGEAIAALETARALAESESTPGLSLRVRAAWWQTLSELHEAHGRAAEALAAVRRWQQIEIARGRLASAARYQAATLQTELLRLQHRLDENVAQRRATERARRELSVANQALSRKVTEVEELQRQLREQVTHDALTGLFNRRHLDETLPAMWALARRDRQPLAVAIIDLDHFKSVNDHHGHAAGDRLLAAFGAILGGALRKSDVACRWGGEEFCLLMPRTGAAAARRKVQALLRRWRGSAFDMPESGAAVGGLTFSAGVTDSELVGASPQALLKRADDELLAAKREGRNRVLAGPAELLAAA